MLSVRAIGRDFARWKIDGAIGAVGDIANGSENIKYMSNKQ